MRPRRIISQIAGRLHAEIPSTQASATRWQPPIAARSQPSPCAFRSEWMPDSGPRSQPGKRSFAAGTSTLRPPSDPATIRTEVAIRPARAAKARSSRARRELHRGTAAASMGA